MTVTSIAADQQMLEQLIYQVRGVQAARLVFDPQGLINEVHVVGTPQRSPKQIVRDIESILLVRGGVRLDHRKISLVQLAEQIGTPQAPRLQLAQIAAGTDEAGPNLLVRLTLRDQSFEGVGRLNAGQDLSWAELAAGAAIQALNAAVGFEGSFRLAQLQRQPLGDLDVFLARLAFVVDDGIETLIGVSVVRDDQAASAARAVLDAANRRVERLLHSVR